VLRDIRCHDGTVIHSDPPPRQGSAPEGIQRWEVITGSIIEEHAGDSEVPTIPSCLVWKNFALHVACSSSVPPVRCSRSYQLHQSDQRCPPSGTLCSAGRGTYRRAIRKILGQIRKEEVRVCCYCPDPSNLRTNDVHL